MSSLSSFLFEITDIISMITVTSCLFCQAKLLWVVLTCAQECSLNNTHMISQITWRLLDLRIIHNCLMYVKCNCCIKWSKFLSCYKWTDAKISFFQIARALRLVLLPQCQGLCGGAAIELMAKEGDPHAYIKHPVMQGHVNCNFSFSGVQTRFEQLIEKQETELGRNVVFVALSFCVMCIYMQKWMDWWHVHTHTHKHTFHVPVPHYKYSENTRCPCLGADHLR